MMYARVAVGKNLRSVVGRIYEMMGDMAWRRYLYSKINW